MVKVFNSTLIADLYDNSFQWAIDDDFYLSHILKADKVIDIGCGTGRTLAGARERGFNGLAVGIDPAEAMIQRARRHSDIEWHVGYAHEFDWPGRFDLAFMTGHSFQYLQTDEEIVTFLRAVAGFLAPGGVFVFETRNPADRAWERWVERYSGTTVTDNGETVKVKYILDPIEDERWISTTNVYDSESWEAPHIRRQTLRFVQPEELDSLLDEAGLRVTERYGWFDRSPFTPDSPEIISVVERKDR